MDTGRRDKTSRSETKDSTTQRTENSMNLGLMSVPLLPNPTEQSRWMLHTQICITAENSKFKEPRSFIMSCKQICLIFASKEKLSLSYQSINKSCPLPHRETVSYSSNAVRYTNILVKIIHKMPYQLKLTQCDLSTIPQFF